MDLSRRLRLKCHPKMAGWERLIDQYGAIVELLLIRNINHVYDNQGLSLSYAIFGGAVCRPAEGGGLEIFCGAPVIFWAIYFCFSGEIFLFLGKVPKFGMEKFRESATQDLT